MTRAPVERWITEIDLAEVGPGVPTLGNGLIEFSVILPEDGPDLIKKLATGEVVAQRRAAAWVKMLGLVMGTGGPALVCTCCNRPLRHVRYSMIFASLPEMAGDRAVAQGICTRCSTDPATLMQKAAEKFREVWSDLRPITITGPGGHA